MEIDQPAIHEVIPQAVIDKVIADEMVLIKCQHAQSELHKLMRLVRNAREEEAAAALMKVTVIKNADEALSKINKMKECMQRTIINLEEKNVDAQVRVVRARAGDAKAAVQRAGDSLTVMGIKNEDMRIESLHMLHNAVSVIWSMVHDSKWANVTGTMMTVKNLLEHAIESAEEEEDIIDYMTTVVNDMDNLLANLQSVAGKVVGWMAAARAAAARARARAAEARAMAAAARAATAVSTTGADVQMTEVNAQMPNTGEEYAWRANLQNPNKRQRTLGGKRKSKKSKRSRRGKKQIKKTKKYKKRSNKKRSNKK